MKLIYKTKKLRKKSACEMQYNIEIIEINRT